MAGVYVPAPAAPHRSFLSIVLIVSTNVVVTSLITFRLFLARRSLAKVLPSSDMRVYTGVITILIESAAPLTIFGVITVVLRKCSETPPSGIYVTIGSTVSEALFYSFCVSPNEELPQQMPFC
jgi:hypothetical protein